MLLSYLTDGVEGKTSSITFGHLADKVILGCATWALDRKSRLT